MNKKFFVFALGCKVNSYELAAISAELISRGYKEDKNDPDVVIINTCSVTATADQKSRQHIRKFQKLYPNAVIAVMGCYSQGNEEYIGNEIKPDILVGTSNRNKLVDYIEQFMIDHKPIVDIDKDTRGYKYEELGVISFSDNVRAYLKIQDGCDNFCTYCLIPYRRGKMRSRNPEPIIKEAEYLVSQGYQEIILTGIHVGGYGQDLENINFSTLVETLLNIPGLRSLRISSIEESEIDDKLISLYASRDNLAKHLHIPLQSGSDTVLKRMNRKYNKAQFLEKINRIRKALPDVMISTDVIVGFPGETDEEFNETFDFIKECGFNMLHVFPFSAREGTAAYLMKNQVSPQIKQQRAATLLDLSKRLYEEYVSRFFSKDIEVLVEKYKNGCNIGHTSNYIEVSVPSNEGKVGQIISVKLEKSMILS